MKQSQVIIAVVTLTACSQGYTVSEFEHIWPKTSLEAAEHECKAYSREDLDKSFAHRFQSCMASKGWKVTYR